MKILYEAGDVVTLKLSELNSEDLIGEKFVLHPVKLPEVQPVVIRFVVACLSVIKLNRAGNGCRNFFRLNTVCGIGI